MLFDMDFQDKMASTPFYSQVYSVIILYSGNSNDIFLINNWLNHAQQCIMGVL